MAAAFPGFSREQRRRYPALSADRPLCLIEGFFQEIWLGQRLAPRESHASSGGFIIVPIEDQLLQHLFGCYFSSDNLSGSRVTGRDTSAIDLAARPILADPAVDELDRFMRAGVKALAAGQAALGTEDQFRFKGLAFRIMAPGTRQRTAL